MQVNRHLLKNSPVYSINNTETLVKLIHVYKTDKGLCFTAEIVNGADKGKWTTVFKKNIKVFK